MPLSAKLALLVLATGLTLPAGAESPATLRDKTLVIWTAPSNLTQRAGSALTLEDNHDHFDGIIFGEIAQAKWMAGSDMFCRTLKDQTGVPAETADAQTFVQIAVVYHSNEITLYRNAQPISHYTASAPPLEFGTNGLVLFGRRHRHQGDSGHFAGRIDDARIYDHALSADQIASLRPNRMSVEPPWTWWTFDDTNAVDRMGRFPISKLAGGARVEGGALVLDGREATVICRTVPEPPFVPETPAMPANPPLTWLTYHLAHPGPGLAMPGDPNCAFFWKGRYHLHYIYNNRDGMSFAHVSSKDMVHWIWHPTTLTPPTTDHGMFSGTGFFTKEGKPAIIYHGQGSGRNQIAFALNDNLEKWSKPIAIEPDLHGSPDASLISHWDPDAWREGDAYYAIFGGSPGSGKPPTLFRSVDLEHWAYLGRFLTKDMPDVQPDEDISCPNFFKIGDQRMLLCISHTRGCRYYLGDWREEKFTPRIHERMNWNARDFFAPESLLTPDGRRVMWAWCNLSGGPPNQSGIQSLPRELSLPQDGVLRIKPLQELETLRLDETAETNLTVGNNHPVRLKEILGDALEIKLTIQFRGARQYGVQVYCDEQGYNGFPITVEPASNTLLLGTMRVPFTLKTGEDLVLRIFLDKNIIEVFANNRQAGVAAYQYPPENLYVSLISTGGNVFVKKIQGWKMRSIYARE